MHSYMVRHIRIHDKYKVTLCVLHSMNVCGALENKSVHQLTNELNHSKYQTMYQLSIELRKVISGDV